MLYSDESQRCILESRLFLRATCNNVWLNPTQLCSIGMLQTANNESIKDDCGGPMASLQTNTVAYDLTQPEISLSIRAMLSDWSYPKPGSLIGAVLTNLGEPNLGLLIMAVLSD